MPSTLYSAPLLVLDERTGAGLRVWQAHISHEDGQWVGWAMHGIEGAASLDRSELARSADLGAVVDELNERMDGRAARGYVPCDDIQAAWIDDSIIRRLEQKLRPQLTQLHTSAEIERGTDQLGERSPSL
jgi:hypothetical protein